MKPIRLGILGSTNGSNLVPLAEELNRRSVPIDVAAVISNQAQCGLLQKAKSQGWPHWFCATDGVSRQAYDQHVSDLLTQNQVDLIVLIGYMRILSPLFVSQWPHRIINVHPSLLPDYAGLMDRQVHQAVLDAGEKQTGCTVHEVNDMVDGGPILVQKRCTVCHDETVESLKKKVQLLEVEALADAIVMIGEKACITQP